jgi:hypothetical protein
MHPDTLRMESKIENPQRFDSASTTYKINVVDGVEQGFNAVPAIGSPPGDSDRDGREIGPVGVDREQRSLRAAEHDLGTVRGPALEPVTIPGRYAPPAWALSRSGRPAVTTSFGPPSTAVHDDLVVAVLRPKLIGEVVHVRAARLTTA